MDWLRFFSLLVINGIVKYGYLSKTTELSASQKRMAIIPHWGGMPLLGNFLKSEPEIRSALSKFAKQKSRSSVDKIKQKVKNVLKDKIF